MSKIFARFLRFPTKRIKEEDEHLIKRVRQNDDAAWASFLARYSDQIYARAWKYAHNETYRPEEIEDEIADIYLFMAGYLKQSLKYYRGDCKPKAWVMSIINNRKRMVKAYLLHKNPEKADVRPPRILQSRPKIDYQIYCRLIWGFEPEQVAQDLDISESQCREIEDLIAQNSPRVYDRIRANRLARKPVISMDGASDWEDTPPIQIADETPSQEASLQDREFKSGIHQNLQNGVSKLSKQERRVLILLYNRGFSAPEVVELAEEKHLGLENIDNVNRVYYVKNKALQKLSDTLTRFIKNYMDISNTSQPEPDKREIIKQVDNLLTEYGVPV